MGEKQTLNYFSAPLVWLSRADPVEARLPAASPGTGGEHGGVTGWCQPAPSPRQDQAQLQPPARPAGILRRWQRAAFLSFKTKTKLCTL